MPRNTRSNKVSTPIKENAGKRKNTSPEVVTTPKKNKKICEFDDKNLNQSDENSKGLDNADILDNSKNSPRSRPRRNASQVENDQRESKETSPKKGSVPPRRSTRQKNGCSPVKSVESPVEHSNNELSPKTENRKLNKRERVSTSGESSSTSTKTSPVSSRRRKKVKKRKVNLDASDASDNSDTNTVEAPFDNDVPSTNGNKEAYNGENCRIPNPQNNDLTSLEMTSCAKRNLSNRSDGEDQLSPNKPVPKKAKNLSNGISLGQDIVNTNESNDSPKADEPLTNENLDLNISIEKLEVLEMDQSENISELENFLLKKSLKSEQASEIVSLLSPEMREKKDIDSQNLEELIWCILNNYNKLEKVSGPRCNKLIRQLLTDFCDFENVSAEEKHKICEECVSWAQSNKRNALSQELEVCLMGLYSRTRHWKLAETTATALYANTKRIQDKEKIVKACLCLSRCYHAMSNIAKSRAFITTAKTEALKIYTPPDLQAELDLQSGVLQITEGRDLETAISYLREAAAGSNVPGQRSLALKYLVLGYILQKKATEGHKVAHCVLFSKDIDDGVKAMLDMGEASSNVLQFSAARERHRIHLEEDIVVGPQLDTLYTQMIYENIRSIILPYEKVQIDHVATQIGLPRSEVEKRLSQMILDRSLSGQIDHRDQCLYLYASSPKDPTYSAALDVISNLGKTVERLVFRANKLLI